MRAASMPRDGEIVAHRLGAARAERDVVFARAALVGMAFDGEGVASDSCCSHCACLSSVARACGVSSVESLSKNTRSPTLTTKSCWLPGVAAPADASRVVGRLVGAGRHGERRDQSGGEPARRGSYAITLNHSGASNFRPRYRT